METSKDKTGQAIYYTCAYVPIEIIIAAGFIPRRLMSTSTPSAGDSYIYPNTCCYLKSLIAFATSGNLEKEK